MLCNFWLLTYFHFIPFFLSVCQFFKVSLHPFVPLCRLLLSFICLLISSFLCTFGSVCLSLDLFLYIIISFSLCLFASFSPSVPLFVCLFASWSVCPWSFLLCFRLSTKSSSSCTVPSLPCFAFSLRMARDFELQIVKGVIGESRSSGCLKSSNCTRKLAHLWKTQLFCRQLSPKSWFNIQHVMQNFRDTYMQLKVAGLPLCCLMLSLKLFQAQEYL